jgi:hypothetical protein
VLAQIWRRDASADIDLSAVVSVLRAVAPPVIGCHEVVNTLVLNAGSHTRFDHHAVKVAAPISTVGAISRMLHGRRHQTSPQEGAVQCALAWLHGFPLNELPGCSRQESSRV